MDVLEEYYTVEQHHQHILSLLNDQRLQNKMSDVILIADEEKFPAHRCVLAAASDYFRSMFEEDHFTECKTKEIQLHSICKEALQVILELVYCGHMKLTVSNMHYVLEASDHLLLNDAKWFCVTFMLKVLESDIACEEVLKIRQSANVFSLPNLKYQTDLLIQQKLTEVTKSQAFLELTCEEVKDIMSLEDTQEADELVFFEACVRWIGYMTETRLQYLDQLMKYVRFPLMPAEILLHIVRPHPWISRSPACMQYIQEALDYLLLPEYQSRSQSPCTKPRCSRHHYGIVYCMAGTEHFRGYIPGHNRWYSLQAPPLGNLVLGAGEGKTLHVRLLSLNGYVFASVQATSPEEVGHFILEAMLVYNIGENNWRACSLPEGIHTGRVVTVATNAGLFACSRQSVYRYWIERDEWEVHTAVQLDPCQFVVSSDCCLHFYNLEVGVLQTVWLDRRGEQEVTTPKHVILTPNRFIADVQGCTKLPNNEVFLQLRTITGVSRKVFNLRSNLWRDFSMAHGPSPLQPRPGFHYPLCVDPADPWEVVCDKQHNSLYVLSLKSGLSDIPATSPPRKGVPENTDAALPFYRLDMTSREWKRLACLPEYLVSGSGAASSVHMCITDEDDSMAVS